MREYKTDIFRQFGENWALLTAGTPESFNMMTVSWGAMGTLWNRDAVTVYVKPLRYTHDFMEREEYFTVSFFPRAYRDKLQLLGTKSGRDMDKMHGSGLTVMPLPHGITFAEAETTLVCRKIFSQRLDAARMPREVVKTYYEREEAHDMYIGEVVDLLRGE